MLHVLIAIIKFVVSANFDIVKDTNYKCYPMY